jgi:hypothetical protein
MSFSTFILLLYLLCESTRFMVTQVDRFPFFYRVQNYCKVKFAPGPVHLKFESLHRPATHSYITRSTYEINCQQILFCIITKAYVNFTPGRFTHGKMPQVRLD